MRRRDETNSGQLGRLFIHLDNERGDGGGRERDGEIPSVSKISQFRAAEIVTV